MTETKTESTLDIRQVYLKDLSFESPQPALSNPDPTPTIDIKLGVSHERLDEDGHYEVVLKITATAKTGDKVLFLTEVQQAGLFLINGFSDEDMGLVLNVACPTILLPFCRAVITDTVTKGGFPQLLISPVNFEALYASKRQQDEAERKADENASPESSDVPTGDVTIN